MEKYQVGEILKRDHYLIRVESIERGMFTHDYYIRGLVLDGPGKNKIQVFTSANWRRVDLKLHKLECMLETWKNS